jgi:hypothetical protein
MRGDITLYHFMQDLAKLDNKERATADDASGGLQSSNESAHTEIVGLPDENAKPKSGLAQRKRGRPTAEVPSQRNLHILLGTTTHTYEEVGMSHGISKQRVSQVVRRWKEYLPVQPLLPRPALKKRCEDEPTGKKERKAHVVSFRLTSAGMKLLHCRYPEMKSAAYAARAIVMKLLSL